MSTSFSTATNPWAKSSGGDLLSLLNEHGYKAVKTESGKYSVDLGNGQKVEFEKWEPIWTVLSRIENSRTKTSNAEKNDNVMENWYNFYQEKYDETTAKLKEAKKKDSWLKRMWQKTKNIFNSCLKRNNAKKVDEIQDTNQRELAKECELDKNNYYAEYRRESNNVYHLAYEGFGYALSAGKFVDKITMSSNCLNT